VVWCGGALTIDAEVSIGAATRVWLRPLFLRRSSCAALLAPLFLRRSAVFWMSSAQSLGHELARGLGIGGKNHLIGELFEHSRLGSLELGVEMARKLDTTRLQDTSDEVDGGLALTPLDAALDTLFDTLFDTLLDNQHHWCIY